MRKVLILASGGLDSTVVIALYKNLGYDVHLLYLPYGNLNQSTEMDKLVKIIDKFKIPQENTYTVDLKLDYSNSGCLNEDGGVLYVEMRNLIFLSYAISMAEAKGIEEVAVGFIQAGADFPDATEEFAVMMNNLAVKTVGIEVRAPLIHLNKEGVYKLGKKLGVDLADTYTCNRSNKKPCGECMDCLDLKHIIKVCDIPDMDNPFKS